MVTTHWEDVRGTELRFRGHTWALTGDLELLGTGERLRVRARGVDGVKHESVDLLFDVVAGEGSLNPGHTGEVFARLERRGDRRFLVVRTGTRTYRYELRGMEYV